MKNSFLLLLVYITFTSCNSFKNEVNRNSKKTNFIFNKLVNENGNAFAITVTHTNFSNVWTYSNNTVEVYKIARGKILETHSYPEQNQDWLVLAKEKDELKFDTCIELDGDGLRYIILNENSKIQNRLPVNIKCFLESKNKNDFYDQLANDIKTYKLELY